MRMEEVKREEMRSKIKLVMEANNGSMTVKEIREHPTMSGVTGQKIGNTLLHMPGVRMGKGKRWTLNGKKTKVKKPKTGPKAGVARGPYKKPTMDLINELEGTKPSFRITKEGKLFLNVNGISFPVEVE